MDNRYNLYPILIHVFINKYINDNPDTLHQNTDRGISIKFIYDGTIEHCVYLKHK